MSSFVDESVSCQRQDAARLQMVHGPMEARPSGLDMSFPQTRCPPPVSPDEKLRLRDEMPREKAIQWRVEEGDDAARVQNFGNFIELQSRTKAPGNSYARDSKDALLYDSGEGQPEGRGAARDAPAARWARDRGPQW